MLINLMNPKYFKIMAIRITKDGIKHVPGPKSYIGKDADVAVKQLEKDLHYKKVCDCIGYSGYRIITMMSLEKRIEIICETDNREEIANDTIPPHEVKWVILDIFKYWNRPIEGKGFY